MATTAKQIAVKTRAAPKGSRKAVKKAAVRSGDDWMHEKSRSGRGRARRTRKTLAALNNLFAAEGGHSLSRPLRRKLERRLQQPLEHIRLHTSARVQQAAMTLGAHAFTLGSHIAFSRMVNPATTDGYRTLLHEAAHAVQQTAAAPVALPTVDPSPRYEQFAERGLAQQPQMRTQAVQRQIAGVGSSPTIRFAQLSSTSYQIIVGGVRIGTVRVTGVESGGEEWFRPAHVVQTDSSGHRVDIGLIHTPGVTVTFSPRSQADVLPLLEARHIFYPNVEEVVVAAGTTPEQFGARLMASAERLAHPPLTEMTMEAPEVRIETSEIYSSRTPGRDPEPEAEPGTEPEEEWSVGTMILQALMGEWAEDPSIGAIVLDTGIGLIPYVDQAMDVRDVSAHLWWMIGRDEYTSILRWVGLVFSLIGAIPEIGTAIKGASKILIRGGQAALSHLDELFTLIRRLLPEGASLAGFRRFLTEHWDEWATIGRQMWMRMLDDVATRLRALPDFLSERYATILQQIRQMSPRMLDDAFARVRTEIDNTMAQIDELLDPHAMTAGPGGFSIPIPDSPRGGDVMHMSGLGGGGGGRSLDEVMGGPRTTSEAIDELEDTVSGTSRGSGVAGGEADLYSAAGRAMEPLTISDMARRLGPGWNMLQRSSWPAWVRRMFPGNAGPDAIAVSSEARRIIIGDSVPSIRSRVDVRPGMGGGAPASTRRWAERALDTAGDGTRMHIEKTIEYAERIAANLQGDWAGYAVYAQEWFWEAGELTSRLIPVRPL